MWATTGQGFRELDPHGILHIKTEGRSDNCCFGRQLNDISKVTVEVRIKVRNRFHLYQAAEVTVIDMGLLGRGAGVCFFENEIQLVDHRASNPWGPTYKVDLTDGYHIVRLVKDSLDVRVYLDNEEKPILEHQLEFNEVCQRQNFQFWGKVNGRFVFTTAPERTWIDENGEVCVKNGSIIEISTNPNKTLDDVKKSFMPDYRIYFGCSASNDSGKRSESYWDYVAYTTKGAFSPRESLEKEVEPQGKLTTTWGFIRTVR